MASRPVKNPANAEVTANAMYESAAANKKMVAHDFTRHLAHQLFATHFGVDLFNNEVALLQNLREICGDDAAGQTWYEITETLKAVSTTGTHADLETDGTGSKYATNALDTNANICRTLHRQLADLEPQRFTPLSNDADLKSIPFAVGDIINFLLVIQPAADQEDLTGVASVAERCYRIQLVMTEHADAADPEIDAAELAPV